MNTKDFKLNLQLFDGVMNTQTTLLDDKVNGNDLSPTIKEFYNKQLLEDAKPNLVHDQFGQKRSIPQGNGKTIEWRKFSSLKPALTPLTEGVTPDGNKLNITTLTAKPDQFGDYIVLSDVLQLTAYDPIVVETTKVLGNQAGLTMDTIIRNKLVEGTNVIFGSDVKYRKDLTADSKLTVIMVQKIVRKLKSQNVPTINGSYVAIIHPDVAFDLMRDPEWIESHKYATPENMYNNEIGKIANVRFVESTQAKILKSEDTGNANNSCPKSGDKILSVYSTLFMGADAYGCVDISGGGLEHIVKQKGSAGVADPLDQRSSVGWKGTQTAVILDETRIVRAETTSTFSLESAEN